jgi:hypothetical protein
MFSNRCRTEISPLDAERLLPTNPKRFSHFEELGAIWGFEICLNSKATRIRTILGAWDALRHAHQGARLFTWNSNVRMVSAYRVTDELIGQVL